MPAGNVSVYAEFEEIPPIASIDVAPTVATNVVVNKTAAAQTVAMTATVNAEEEKTLTDEQKTVTWSASGVEGVTIDESTGELSIPANTNTGTVTVTATSSVRDDKSGTATVRIDPELVSTSGKITTIYVSSDVNSDFGGGMAGYVHEYYIDKHNIGDSLTHPENQELIINGAKTDSSGWGARAKLTFALPESLNVAKIYTATLNVPAGYGYQNRSQAEHISANGITSANTMNPYENYNENNQNIGTILTVNMITNKSAMTAGSNYDVEINNADQSHSMSVLSREYMGAGNRGAYLVLTEGYNITYKYVDGDSQPVSGVAVTLSDGQTETTNASGEVTFLVAGGTDYTATTEAGTYKATSTKAENVTEDVNKTVTLDLNNQAVAALDIVSTGLNTDIITTTLSSKAVGKLSTIQYAKEDKSEEMGIYENVTYNAPEESGITIESDGTVKISSATTAGSYNITATASGKTSDAYALVVKDSGTEKILAASEDFEGTTNIFGAESADSMTAGKANVWDSKLTTYYNHVLVAPNATATATITNAPAAETDRDLSIAYTLFNGYLGTGNKSGTYSQVTLKNSDGAEILRCKYITNDSKFGELTIGGEAPYLVTDGAKAETAGFTAFDGISGTTRSDQNANGWNDSGKPFKDDDTLQPHVTVKISSDRTVTITFVVYPKTAAQTTARTAVTTVYTGTLAAGTKTDLGAIEYVTDLTNTGRAGGIDNIVTTLTKAE